MRIQPTYPVDRADRKKAIHAALIADKCLAKRKRLQIAEDHNRAKATFHGLIGFLVSQNVSPEHLTWARIQLRCHATGGQA